MGNTPREVTNEPDGVDDIVMNYWRTVVASAGNLYTVGDTAAAYNVIGVGNVDIRNTVTRSDDIMQNDTVTPDVSAYEDPYSIYADREKPEISAPGHNTYSTSTQSPRFGNFGGTSAAAPFVTGTAGLLLQANTTLQFWPEAVKAIAMATTYKLPGEDPQFLHDQSGAGGLDSLAAANVARSINGGGWLGRAFGCSASSTSDTITLSANKSTRIVLVFHTDPADPDYSYQPSADLDLEVYDPNNSRVFFAEGNSYDNTYEVAYFQTSVSGNYVAKVTNLRCDVSPRYIARPGTNSEVKNGKDRPSL